MTDDKEESKVILVTVLYIYNSDVYHSEWRSAAMDTNTTFAFFFEIVNKDSTSAAASAAANNNPSHGGATAAPGGQFFIQFITRYYKLTGEVSNQCSSILI